MSNYDLTKILPHNPPMILIDDVLEYDLNAKILTAVVTINEEMLFFDKTINGVSSLIGIEFMHRQSAAIHILKAAANRLK